MKNIKNTQILKNVSLSHLSVIPSYSHGQPLLPFYYVYLDRYFNACVSVYLYFIKMVPYYTLYSVSCFLNCYIWRTFPYQHLSASFFFNSCMMNRCMSTYNLPKQSTIALVRIHQVVLQRQIIPHISVFYFLFTKCLLSFWATVQGKCFPDGYSVIIC